MKQDALQGAEKYTKAHQRKKRWYQVVTGLACVVVFCTVYALILPAITMEKGACEIPEHTHSEACYTQVTSVTRTEPVCTIESLNLHQHDDTCYDSEGNLTCGYADFVVHRHDSACYDENGNLWCPLPEIETHKHTESCYAVPEASAEVHTHTDDCYTVERGELICTESTEPAHEHTDDCCTETSALACAEDHEHSESCYETVRELTCGYTEEPAHEHTDECYEQKKTLTCDLSTNPVEEAESAEPELICDKTEVILHEHTSDCFDDDGNLICGKIQVLEHQHTDACFETVEEPVDTEALTCTLPEDENHTHGLLCYGTWVLTCSLKDHIHSEECTPAAPELVYVCGEEAHTHSETCRDDAGELICGLEEHAHSEECQGTDTPAEDQIFTVAGEDYTVSVMPGPDSGLPENIELTVTEITEGSEEYETYFLQAEQALRQAGSADPLVFARFFDVKLISDGEPVEPAAPVSVSITYADMEGLESADCHAVHFTEEGVELLEAAAEKSENGDVSVTHIQSSFSVVGNVVTQAEDYSISAYADAPTAGLDHNVTFMVKVRDEWVKVGSCTYDTSTVGDRSASVSSDVLHQYLDDYGYSAEPDPTSTLKCSYDDIYTIYYAQNGAATGFAVDIKDGSIIKDAFLHLWEVQGQVSQSFRIWRVVDNYYFLTPLSNSGLHVNLHYSLTDNETPLWLHSALDEASWWGIRNNDDGTVSFYSQKKTSAYINLAGNRQENGTTIQLYEAEDGNRWKLVQKYDEQNVVTSSDRVGLTAESNGNIVCFYTPSTPLNDPNAIYTAEELSKLGTSGNYYLGCDITVNEVTGQAASIGDGVSSTLDLKGHTIHYNVPTNDSGSSMIYLHGSGSLTITDSGQAAETTEVVTGQPLYGNQASYDSSTKTLVYYVTESRPNGDGTTTETLVKHTVDLSNVGTVCSETTPNQFFFVAGSASLNIQGGLFTNPGGLRVASAVDSSNINISGGYLCGCVSNNVYGGAISSDSTGALTISGGVIAGNQAGKGGGVYKKSGTFTMTGGVISGNVLPYNTVSSYKDDFGKGGGVFLESVSSVFSGGYITNNRVDYYCGNAGEGHHFGGGIAQYYGTFTMESGAYLTGNYHSEAGGGIGFNGEKLIMTGGTVAANVAQNAEGGGIRIQESSQTSLISGGYVTNNRTNSTHDWGGGGIFVCQGQSMQILNAVFQKNSADGFGGGVGGCSTGQIVAVDNTAGSVAIFDNHANGQTMAGSDGNANVKQDDLTARSNEVFMTNGYNDFFCALNSAVSGTMLGGGAQNWHGSCDYEAIDIGKDQIVTANKMMGLNASPTDADKQTAIQQGTVFVSGNYSQTHGGGIMSNGILILGQARDISLSPGLEIEAYKSFKDANGNTLDQQPGQFQFLLQDGNHNTIATVSNNAYGMVLAEQDYTQTGTYTYYLKEQPGSSPLITYDETEYQITVTVGTDTKTLNLSAYQSMTITYYVVTNIQVSFSSGTGTVSTETSNVGSDNHRATVMIGKDGGTAFTNTMNEKPLYFRITKLNGHTNEPLQFVEFTLKDESGNVVTSGKTDQDGYVSLQIEKGKNYRLYETTFHNFMPAGPWILEVGADGNVTFFNTTTGADGSISKSGAGTACTKEEKDVAVYYDHTITNLIGGCELPNTGGAGTVPYTIGGFLLLTGAALLLLYHHTRRRKEDPASS